MRGPLTPPPRTFTSPGLVGDVLMSLVLLPLAGFILTALLAMPLLLVVEIVAGRDPAKGLDDRLRYPVLVVASVLAALLLLTLLRLKGFRSVTLEPSALRLGRLWPRRIPYEQILYIGIRGGHETGPFGGPPTGTLVIARGWFREDDVYLRTTDAQVLLHQLYEVCPNAAAMDRFGAVLSPGTSGVRPYQEFRLARAFAVRAAIAFLAGAIGMLALVVSIVARRRNLSAQALIRGGLYLWLLVVGAPSLFAYGVLNARRALRVLRGDLTEPS